MICGSKTWCASGLIAACGALTGISAGAKGSVVLEKVIQSSDAVPGTSGVTWVNTINVFQNPSIDESGKVAFRGTVSGATNNTGYWYGAPGTVGLVARVGDATLDNANSGGVGATITSVQTQITPLSVDGKLWVGATIAGGSVVGSGTNADNRIFWTGPLGSMQRHVRRWDVMPGTAGARFSSAPDSVSSPQVLNRSGVSWVGGTLAANVGDTGAIGTNDGGMWVGPAGGMQLAMRRQDAAPGFTGGERLQNVATLVGLNDSSTIVASPTLRTAEFGVTTSNDAILVRGTAGSLTTFAREGGATGVAGINFGVQTSTLFPTFQFPRVAINNSGLTAFQSATPLTGAGVTTGVDDAAIFINQGAGNSIFQRKGSAAPGIASTTLSAFGTNDWTVTNSNQIAWTAQIAGGSVTTSSDRALWMSNLTGSDVLVSREGDAAPGISNAFFGEPNTVVANALGQVIFTSTLTGSGVTTANDRTIWLWDPAAGLCLVAREGDSYFGVAGTNISYDTNASGSGTAISFTDNGWFTFRVTGLGPSGLTEGVVIRMQVPTPAGAALLVMGGLLAARRRRA